MSALWGKVGEMMKIAKFSSEDQTGIWFEAYFLVPPDMTEVEWKMVVANAFRAVDADAEFRDGWVCTSDVAAHVASILEEAYKPVEIALECHHYETILEDTAEAVHGKETLDLLHPHLRRRIIIHNRDVRDRMYGSLGVSD